MIDLTKFPAPTNAVAEHAAIIAAQNGQASLARNFDLALEFAKQYCDLGWRVMPVEGGMNFLTGEILPDKAGKNPWARLVPHGLKDATNDWDTVRKWIHKYPACNLGIATGAASGIFMVGPDGDIGIQHLAELEAKHGALPATLTARSGGGGLHLIFRYPTDGRIIPGALARHRDTEIDIRGDGGYFVAAPSVHTKSHGNRYQWLTDLSHEIAVAPDWLISWCQKKAKKHHAAPATTTTTKSSFFAPDSAEIRPNDRPGDWYNEHATWEEILTPHGWRIDHVGDGATYWTRPGKSGGVSATTGYCKGPHGGDLLHVFSGNARPFASEQTYSKFFAFTLLNHHGDFSSAAREIGEKLREHREKTRPPVDYSTRPRIVLDIDGDDRGEQLPQSSIEQIVADFWGGGSTAGTTPSDRLAATPQSTPPEIPIISAPRITIVNSTTPHDTYTTDDDADGDVMAAAAEREHAQRLAEEYAGADVWCPNARQILQRARTFYAIRAAACGGYLKSIPQTFSDLRLAEITPHVANAVTFDSFGEARAIIESIKIASPETQSRFGFSVYAHTPMGRAHQIIAAPCKLATCSFCGPRLRRERKEVTAANISAFGGDMIRMQFDSADQKTVTKAIEREGGLYYCCKNNETGQSTIFSTVEINTRAVKNGWLVENTEAIRQIHRFVDFVPADAWTQNTITASRDWAFSRAKTRKSLWSNLFVINADADKIAEILAFHNLDVSHYTIEDRYWPRSASQWRYLTDDQRAAIEMDLSLGEIVSHINSDDLFTDPGGGEDSRDGPTRSTWEFDESFVT